MDKDELIAMLYAPMQFQMVANSTAIVENNHVDVKDLLDITFHKKKEIAFRAAWMLEYIMVHKPNAFIPQIPAFLELLPRQKNHSAMRHYTKVVSLMTDKKASPLYQQAIADIAFEPIIEQLFIWLVEPEILVATKVHCMQSLANLASKYLWIKEELIETIHHLMELESIAFFARAKMVLKGLKKLG